jgi:hypothetical protein
MPKGGNILPYPIVSAELSSAAIGTTGRECGPSLIVNPFRCFSGDRHIHA